MNMIETEGLTPDQYKSIFDKYYGSIKNFLYYRSGELELAEDLTQEVFLKVWEVKHKVRIDTVGVFVYSIANNLFINQYHRNNLKLKFVNNYKSVEKPESPEFVMEMKEFDEKLQKALSDLTEKQRVVFLMNRIDGLTYNEIADFLDISVKAVEKRMQKAIEALYQKLNRKL